MVEVGEVLNGKITGLTKFGAFVSLGNDKVGMVHISEVSNQFVKDIADFLEKGQEISVKVIGIDDAGKISLSIKQVEGNDLQPRNGDSKDAEEQNHKDKDFSKEKSYSKDFKERKPRPQPNVWQGQKKETKPASEMTFEEMMAKFKVDSDSKMADYKHATESKHGGYNRRGGNKHH